LSTTSSRRSFGTDEFKQAPPSGHERKLFLHDLYQRQLQDVCGFRYVQSFEMINDRGRTPYYLFFCTSHIKGLEVMKGAMWKLAPTGDYRFSDLLAGHEVLFGAEVEAEPLQENVVQHFRGQLVTVEQVEEYVLVQTPFTKSHVRRYVLKPLQQANRIEVPEQAKRFTYPTGRTRVRFL
jgi:hypothetical protein